MGVSSGPATLGTDTTTWVAAQVGGALEAVFDAVAATRADTAAAILAAQRMEAHASAGDLVAV
ncbi:hypothetical protein [Streptomyces sp. 900105245]